MSRRTSHRAAALADLQEIVARIRKTQNRLAELERERKVIDDEIEFYKNRPLPLDLARRRDGSEAKFTALADVFRGEESDVRTVVARYHCERTQFAERWHGGAPGSSACAAACRTGT